MWDGQEKNGRNIDEDASRVAEVKRLQAWIDRSMAGHAPATRIIAMDMNDARESPPWRELAKDYADGFAKKATWKSPRTGESYRYDYVFWDDTTDAARRGKGFPAPYTSTAFTSDHQFVVADIPLR